MSGYVTAYSARGLKTLLTFKQLEECIITLSQGSLFESAQQKRNRMKQYRYNVRVHRSWIKENGVFESDLHSQE